MIGEGFNISKVMTKYLQSEKESIAVENALVSAKLGYLVLAAFVVAVTIHMYRCLKEAKVSY